VLQSGGGWGDPLERDAALVLDDFLDEKIDAQHARDAYGVVIDAGRVDEAATAALRARLGAARAAAAPAAGARVGRP
jgi:N-methylhydantoinase B